MPRRSLFCASAPTGLVHWYQPRLGGAHLHPHVRTRRGTERGGGGDEAAVVKARSWRCLVPYYKEETGIAIEAGMFPPQS